MRYALEHGAGLTGSAICDRDDESRAEPAGDRGGAERRFLAIGKEDRPARNWTKEQDRILRELVKAGEPGSVVAAKLRKTRNAVIGRAHRLGLTFAGGKPKSVSVEANRKQGGIVGGIPSKTLVEARQKAKGFQAKASEDNGAENAPKRGGRGMAGEVSRLVSGRTDTATSEGMDVTAGETAPHFLSLVALTEHTCKWPVGDPHDDDFGFCGQNTRAKSPYCQHHHDRAYTRAERVEA